MNKYYQCNNKAEADALNAQIFEDLKTIAQAQGYPVVNGEIVPKRNGIPDFSAQRTTAWDVPQVDPKDDTKYMVRHPDKLSGLQVLKPGHATKYIDDITSKISNREVTRTAKDFEELRKIGGGNYLNDVLKDVAEIEVQRTFEGGKDLIK
jgi:hypothetical protein